MKNSKIKTLSLLISAFLLLPTLASCTGGEIETTAATTSPVIETTETVTSDTDTDATTITSSTSETIETEASSDDTDAFESESYTESYTESDADETTDVTTTADEPQVTTETEFAWVESLPLEGEYASTITLASKTANGVNVSYPSSARDHILIENMNMSLDYSTSTFADKQVSAIYSASGKSYIENTMDVFVKMAGVDQPFYASSSANPALMNIYRYGYYYYQVLIDGQDFTSKINVEKELDLGLSAPDGFWDLTVATPTSSENAIAFTVKSTNDPRMQYIKSFTPYSADEYNYIAVTMKVSGKSTSVVSATAWIIAGEKTTFGSQSVGFRPVADGEFHTYYIRVDGVTDYTGNVKGLRFDLDGLVGDTFEIKDIKAVKANTDGAPLLGLNRIFNTYSDKLVQTLQITAKADTTNIEKIGMVTRIAKDTVDKLIVKDAGGNHTSLDDVDWETAEYIGFDIKNVGIFGYILLPGETSGMLEVKLDGDNYVITQSRAPEGNEILKPTSTTLNTKDFYMGQRIYTDESHSFDAFLLEAYCERNPLPAENITVDYESSTKGAYIGYNALRGTYEFTLASSGFVTAYYYEQNKHCGVRFTVKGDGYDRTIYIQSTLEDGQLECAAVLDKDNLLLPIPIEVGKNFADGDHTIHWMVDDTYSETYFPIIIGSGEEQTYNLLHLYQNWGRYPLKQISFIQFHCPYYHLSTGVTETNCIVNWYTTKGARNIYSVLPDHRPMSAPFWSSEPQHTSGGSHGFLEYTDSEGNYNATENIKNVITSYGPTYAEIVMDYISDDGKIKVSYTHMEMPQTDENRTYYTMKYEVLEDVSFNNFREDFTLYTVMPKSDIKYEYLAFYSEANKSVSIKTSRNGKNRSYRLSKDQPYFAVYQATEDSSGKDNYVNLSFLIHSAEFTIGGESADPYFILNDHEQEFKLSLDLGEVTLKAGDSFTINAIIMPWGSQKTVYESEEEGFMAYKNVHDVRENSLVNDLKATAIKDCVVDKSSVFLPTVCSTNGRSAEFTLSGGANNCTVKLMGFTRNTIPTVYELKGGEWVRYNLSSYYYPDRTGYKNTYDGYGVQYEENGLFTYSFVVKMVEGIDRTFKFVVDEEEYKNNPEIQPENGSDDIIPPAELVEGYNRYYGADDIKVATNEGNSKMGKIEIMTDSTGEFVRMYGTGTNDPYFYLYSAVNEEDPLPTGQFFVFKYRLSSTNTDGNWMTIFSSTEKMTASTSTTIKYSDMAKDDQWHVVIINYALTQPDSFKKDVDGGYYAKHLRFDVFGTSFPSTSYIDFQYMAFDDSFDEILEANKDMATVTYYDGDFYTVKTDGGKMPQKIVIEDDNRTYDTPFTLYYSARMLAHRMLANGTGMKDELIELVETPDGSYVTLWGNKDEAPNESYLRFYVDNNGQIATGQYLVIKYKTTIDSYMEVYASTESVSPNNDERVGIDQKNKLYVHNGEWQIVIIDLASLLTIDSNPDDENSRGFKAAADGNYYAKVLRIDPFNSKGAHETGLGVTFGFIGICGDDALDEAICFDTSVDAVLLYDGTLTAYDPNTGDVIDDYKTPTITPPVVEEETTEKETEEEVIEPAEQVEGYNRYFGSETLTAKGSAGSGMGRVETITEGDVSFTRFYGTGTNDPQFYLYRASQDTEKTPTGQYLVFKYRLADGCTDNNWIDFFINTTTPNAANNYSITYSNMTKDGEWHVIVFDLAKAKPSTFVIAENGGYYAQHLRVDIFGKSFPESSYIDVEFIAFDDSLDEILAANSDLDSVTYYDGAYSTLSTAK